MAAEFHLDCLMNLCFCLLKKLTNNETSSEKSHLFYGSLHGRDKGVTC